MVLLMMSNSSVPSSSGSTSIRFGRFDPWSWWWCHNLFYLYSTVDTASFVFYCSINIIMLINNFYIVSKPENAMNMSHKVGEKMSSLFVVVVSLYHLLRCSFLLLPHSPIAVMAPASQPNRLGYAM
jgi:hypothetical protein